MIYTDLLDKYSQVFVPGLKKDHAKEVFKNRRKKQLKALNSVTLFFGAAVEPNNDAVHLMNGMRLFQEPSILYLTGINQTGVILVLDSYEKDGEILFISKKDPTKEFWDGVRLGVEEIASGVTSSKEITDLTGIKKVLPITEFDSWISNRLKNEKKVDAFFHTYNTKTRISKLSDQNSEHIKKLKKTLKNSNKKLAIESCAQNHFELRLTHDEWQIAETKHAQKLTKNAFLKLLPSVPTFKSEHAIKLDLEHKLQLQSVFGLAFPTIVANEQNACVLHYQKSDASFKKNSLLLLDFGIRFGTMHSDISRTIPINGIFNPLQKLLYQIILDAQKLNESLIKPGAMIQENDWKVWSFIENQLNSQFFSAGGKARRDYKTKPHGVSHLIGEQCHEGDPFRLYQVEPLKEGMLLSNEPGIYGYFEMKIDGKTYKEYIGIRIEDNIYVTKTGCLNISKSIPKQINQLERLISKGA